MTAVSLRNLHSFSQIGSVCVKYSPVLRPAKLTSTSTHAKVCDRQELQPSSRSLRAPPGGGEVYLPGIEAGLDRRREANREARQEVQVQLRAPDARAGAQDHERGRGANRGLEELPHFHHGSRRARVDRAGRAARDALAPERGRVVVLHRGPRARDDLRVRGLRAHLRLRARRRRDRAAQHGPFCREYRR